MNESEMYFNFLLYVIAADNIVENEEVEFLEGAMEQAGISEQSKIKIQENLVLIRKGEKLPDINELLEEISLVDNPSFILNLIKDSYALASSDGSIHENELETIKLLVNKLFDNGEKFFEEIMNWVNQSIEIDNLGLELLNKISTSN